MKERYLDLQTGRTLSVKEILEVEDHKDIVWEAADELRSLLADIAEAKEEEEEEAQGLLMEVAVIRDYLNKYDVAQGDLLDNFE
jgi:hypothetical protein